MIKPREFEGKIKNISEVREDLLEVSIELESNFEFDPGQFLNAYVTPPYKRPYSILESEGNIAKILVGVREPGLGADFFRNASVGQQIVVFGPLGRFKMRETESKQILYVSAGTGLVPFVSMIKYGLQNFHTKKLKLLNGVRHYHEDPALFYLEQDINSRKLDYTVCVSRDEVVSQGFKGRVTEYLKVNDSIDFENTDFYICGANQMVKDVRNYLREQGVKNIFVENYG